MMNVTGTSDYHHMQRALQLAEGGRGRTSPNPMTGCVVVNYGRVIGEGFHERHGARHAEAAALDACREMMEYLKSRATFWKKETLADATDTAKQRWVDNISG